MTRLSKDQFVQDFLRWCQERRALELLERLEKEAEKEVVDNLFLEDEEEV